MSIGAMAECWGRSPFHSRSSRPAAARRYAAPPCSRASLRLSPEACRPGSGCFFKPVGVVQPAEDGGADDLGSLRQLVRVGLRLDGDACLRVASRQCTIRTDWRVRWTVSTPLKRATTLRMS